MLYFAQVMHMDKAKTGALIAEVRKMKNLTQKDLAETLHVSDRAVSKWERGAGFPDVSLLEPFTEPDLSQYPNAQYTGGYPPKQ